MHSGAARVGVDTPAARRRGPHPWHEQPRTTGGERCRGERALDSWGHREHRAGIAPSRRDTLQRDDDAVDRPLEGEPERAIPFDLEVEAGHRLSAPRNRPVRVTYVGGPTALLEFAGARFLTDPTFDPGGTAYPTPHYTLHKLAGPTVPPAAVLPVDAVLLSHDHHFDNLDHAGRALLPRAGLVLTTPPGAPRP